MWIDSVIEYDIIVETLTGAEIEVTVTDDDTIGYIKTHIQKFEGIPVRQQHLIYNQHELSDSTEVKDVPLSHGSRLKLVLGLKGGPVSAQRRLVKMPDLDTWFDLNAARQDQFTISSPGVKLLVYKDCKKNVHRVKLRSDRKNMNNPHPENALDLSVDVDDQFLKDNLNTMEKMHQLRTQLELKKRDKDSKFFHKFGTKSLSEDDDNDKNIGSSSASHFKLKNESIAEDGGSGSGAVGGAISKLDASTSKTPRKYSRRIYLPPLKGFIENATSLKKLGRSEADSFSAAVDNNKHQMPASNTKSTISELDCLNPSPVIRPDETIWQSKVMNDTPKSKRKLTKSNWIQSLIEIMKTSKVQLSPGELIEIKESFESIKETTGKERSTSPQMQNKPNDEFKQASFESILSNFNRATLLSTSEAYRSRIRDNIRRNRSFKAVGTNDLIIEENRRLKYSLNPMHKSKSGHHFSANRSIDDLPETSNRSSSMLSLRSCSSTSSSASQLIDLKYPIESENSHRLYSRQMSAPKFTSTRYENKLHFEKPGVHPFGGSRVCDERKSSFSTDFHKFKSNSAGNFGPSTAKAIADSSSFRVYKMAADAKNYELPKLLIREGSPIESFHSSDTQLETLALRCDSPKSALPTPDSTIDITASATSTEPLPVQLNTVLSATADIMEPNPLNESTELNRLLYDHENSINYHANHANGDQVNESSLVSNSSENGSCELLHNSKSAQANDFRTTFGSSPLLNYNTVSSSSSSSSSRCLDNIPLKYRRGYSNLNDACLSSSTSNIKDILRSNRSTKESLRNAVKSTITSNNIGTSSGNSMSQEIFSFLRNQNNAPATYVRSYENLDRTKIVCMKNDGKRIMGNTNYGYAEGDSMPSYSNCSQISNSSSNNSQDWRYGKSYDDDMKEEGASTDYSYSNLAYDNAEATTNWNSELAYQSDDSLLNFDATDDDVFQIDSLNLLSVADSPLQSDQSFFDDDDAVTNTSESNNCSKRKSMEKTELPVEHGLLVPEIPNLISLSDGNLVKLDRINVQCNSSEQLSKNKVQTSNQFQSDRVRNINDMQTSMIAKQTLHKSIESNANSKPIVTEPTKLTADNPRCAQCNKKLGIVMVMKCHCEKMFCAKHRYAEAHNCSFDFKREGKKTIAEENPLIVANKITKI